MGHPAVAFGTLVKQFGLDPMRATALSDIARQVVGAMSNPAQAQAALARYAQQQGLRQNEVAFLQALTQQTARLAAPAGAAAGMMMPATQEGVR
jgi:cell pole-organizing protein PopZ